MRGVWERTVWKVDMTILIPLRSGSGVRGRGSVDRSTA